MYLPEEGRKMLRLIMCLWVGLIAGGTVWAQDSLLVETARKSITLSGYTRSRTKQTLAAEVAGKVLKVNYDVGQVVGDKPFLEIDPTFIDFQIDQAHLTLQKLKIAKNRAQSQKDYLQTEFKRIDRLRQDKVTTRAKWDAAAEDLKQAELSLQTNNLEINSLALRLKELQERRSRHALMAPTGWIVVQRKVEPGEIIADSVPLGQVADFTQMVVPLFVSGQQLTAIKKQDQPYVPMQDKLTELLGDDLDTSQNPLYITVEGKPARGRLKRVNPDFDERSRKLSIEVAVVGFKGDARGGLLTKITINVPSDGLMVPKASVSRRYDNPNVILKKDGKTIPVTILDEDQDYFIIADTKILTVGMELRPR
jgi:multidrug efflux pump subunit AcrA (membrane-fusion protein)